MTRDDYESAVKLADEWYAYYGNYDGIDSVMEDIAAYEQEHKEDL